jgi:hypothetical protein
LGFFCLPKRFPTSASEWLPVKLVLTPSYPAINQTGFAMNGPVQAGPGVVTLNFASNSDDRAFQISQRPSSWNSGIVIV